MLSFNIDTPKDVQAKIASKFRQLRTFRKLTRKTLATMSGVTESSIKRFERTGDISLYSLLRLADVLGALAEFLELFVPPVASSLDEIERRENHLTKPSRSRGRL